MQSLHDRCKRSRPSSSASPSSDLVTSLTGLISRGIRTSISPPMALGSTGRRLLVPSADVLAKNMRAVESARAAASAPQHSSSSDNVSPTLLMGVGAAVEVDTEATRRSVRFRRAEPDAQSNLIISFFKRVFGAKKNQSADSSEKEKSGMQKAFEKTLPHLEKGAELASRLPDPTVLYLAVVLVVLLIDRLRPQWFESILVRVAATSSFIPLIALALLWRKTELFAQLREGQNPLTHPAEHRLDGLEAELTQREEEVRQAEGKLQNDRAQLDALRKELGKDPHAQDPEAVIMPSRKAAEMIAAGALGVVHDEKAAQAVEARRKEESVKKSREEWRLRTEETESQAEQTIESLKLMADHAATAYTKRTRELKTRTSSGTPKATDKLMHLKKVVQVVREADDIGRRTSRYSERSGASVANSTSSRKRLALFRRRRRTTDQSNPTEQMMVRPNSGVALNSDSVDV